MSGPAGGRPRPFTPSELDGATGVSPDEVAGSTRVARDLEAVAGQTPVTAPPDFADRVMAAIATEPAPAPVRVAGRALRAGTFGAFLGSIRDAWRVTTGPGFPMAARAQALALVLVVAVLATGSGMATAGALGLLGGDDGPSPAVEPPSQPVVDGSTVPSASTEPGVEPSPSADASESPEPSEPAGETGEPAETGEPSETDDHSRSGGGGRETATPDDHESEDGSDDDHDTPEPSRTPRPSETPTPTETPDPEEHSAAWSAGDMAPRRPPEAAGCFRVARLRAGM
jgi:hypothetical protein